MGKIILDVCKISKSYNNGENDLHVLRDLSLKVCEKEVVTITGKSGSGKSTLLNILGTFLKIFDINNLYLDLNY